MLHISDDGIIKLTRGDTARLRVPITNDIDGSEYELESDDILYFSVKKTVKDENYLFQKVVTGTNLFHIEPIDTKGLNYGIYKYDVQLSKANGDVYTVIEPKDFEITTEVTHS